MIVCCGYVNVDLSVRVPRLPSDGARVQATAMERQAGGMAANAAAAAAAFGAEVAFVGTVGDDPDGRWLVDDLADRGIDVTGVASDRRTTHCLVLVAPDGQRAIISEDDHLRPADLRSAYDRAAATAGVLYLDGYRWPAAATVLNAGGSRPVIVSDLDGCESLDGLHAAARTVDHLLCSRSHFAQLVGTPAAEDVARVLARDAGTAVVLTDGARGWWAVAGGQERSGAALPVEAVDTTGAGDAFCGAYLAEIERGAGVFDAARAANAAAALSTTGAGARDRLARREEIDALLSEAGRGLRLDDQEPREARP